MKGIKLLAATAALTVSSVAIAGPNYTYAQLGFYTAESNGNEDSGGFELNGSFGFADLFHVGAGIASGEEAGGRSKQNDTTNLFGADTDSYELYFGVNPAITDNIDAIARVGYRETEIKGRGLTGSGVDYRLDNEALFLTFGTRALITEKFELNAFATYSAGSNEINVIPNSKQDFVDWTYQVGGIYNFTDMFAAGITLDIEDGGIGLAQDASPTVGRGNVGTIFARVNF